jgi:hypothetical protein
MESTEIDPDSPRYLGTLGPLAGHLKAGAGFLQANGFQRHAGAILARIGIYLTAIADYPNAEAVQRQAMA